MIVPNYLKGHLEKQWQRTLHVFMKTWNTISVHKEFWIFENKNRKIKVIFEWNNKQFYFVRR